MRPIIRVENIGKQYRIGRREVPYATLRESLVQAAVSPINRLRRAVNRSGNGSADSETHIWALNNISFEVKPGEVVGIIGPNGAGKSTLLKILSRITEPTVGCVDIFGRVGSLLEVGTGFHPELTGRENIYLNGAILGMRRREIEGKFEEIVEFAEIGKYIDTPVKRFSSGMYLRLAFAVAAHLESEILLVDEVLAVGDAQFQKKCLGKIKDVSAEGRTVLFVSHNMAAVHSLARTGLLLKQGNCSQPGKISDIINEYISCSASTDVRTILAASRRNGTGTVQLLDVRVSDPRNPGSRPSSGSPVRFDFILLNTTNSTIDGVEIGFSLHDRYNSLISILYSSYTAEVFKLASGINGVSFTMNSPLLAGGQYQINCRISRSHVELDWPRTSLTLDIVDGDYYSSGRTEWREAGCLVLTEGRWSCPNQG